MNQIIAGGLSIWTIFGIIVLILWILLPFAVFGVKDRLDTLIAKTSRTNALLKELLDAQKNKKSD